MVRFGKFTFHVFDRYEIHIQAFVDFINGKLMSGHSSSSTFHDFQEFIISNYQNFRSSNLRIFKFRNFKNRKVRYTGLRTFRNLDSQISMESIFPYFPKDVP